MIISHLLEHPDYPKAGKRKSEAVVAAASSSKRAKIDYLAEGREPITDTSYISVALVRVASFHGLAKGQFISYRIAYFV
jgi:hypothetical protein